MIRELLFCQTFSAKPYSGAVDHDLRRALHDGGRGVAHGDDGVRAEALGFDLIGTTLYGYTKEPIPMPAPNFEMMHRLASDLNKPVIAEGGIFSPEQLRTAMDQGVHACVVGSAITRPMEITRRYVKALQ